VVLKPWPSILINVERIEIMQRRQFLGSLGASLIVMLASFKGWAFAHAADSLPAGSFPFTLTDEEWKKRLSPEQYRILRQQGTEMAFSSPLNSEHGQGEFDCAGCANPLFSSATKFDSGTGWPSFWQPIGDKAIQTTNDNSLFMSRTEVHCANCGGHLGHVFDDGPKPTGLRYCMDGAAMVFKPAAS
jgi:peptide-methionine (R)-S-oxide reductase